MRIFISKYWTISFVEFCQRLIDHIRGVHGQLASFNFAKLFSKDYQRRLVFMYNCIQEKKDERKEDIRQGIDIEVFVLTICLARCKWASSCCNDRLIHAQSYISGTQVSFPLVPRKNVRCEAITPKAIFAVGATCHFINLLTVGVQNLTNTSTKRVFITSFIPIPVFHSIMAHSFIGWAHLGFSLCLYVNVNFPGNQYLSSRILMFGTEAS